MGGERASTTRRREAGKICCFCGIMLDTPLWHPPGERACERCEKSVGSAIRHRIHMFFFVRGDGSRHGQWLVSYTEADCCTSICNHIFRYAHPDKIRAIAERGNALKTPKDRFEFEREIKHGRGTLWLELSEWQYRALKRVKPNIPPR